MNIFEKKKLKCHVKLRNNEYDLFKNYRVITDETEKIKRFGINDIYVLEFNLIELEQFISGSKYESIKMDDEYFPSKYDNRSYKTRFPSSFKYLKINVVNKWLKINNTPDILWQQESERILYAIIDPYFSELCKNPKLRKDTAVIIEKEIRIKKYNTGLYDSLKKDLVNYNHINE